MSKIREKLKGKKTKLATLDKRLGKKSFVLDDYHEGHI